MGVRRHPVGRYSAGGVVARDGSKEESDTALHHWTHDQIHEGAYNPVVRLEVMDDCGTDFPHPTCLYPEPVKRAEEKMASLAPGVRKKILGENARKLYRL